jgi:hypothetical protein
MWNANLTVSLILQLRKTIKGDFSYGSLDLVWLFAFHGVDFKYSKAFFAIFGQISEECYRI